MRTSIEFDHEKATQVINFFARKEWGKRIDKVKVIKLIWLADRFHLRKYGRPMIKDTYFAMPRGPVPSGVKDLIERNDWLSSDERNYSENFLERHGDNIKSIKDIQSDVFSDSDVEVLELVSGAYGDYQSTTLSTISHKFPEWSKFKESLNSGATRKEMSYTDFFLNPEKSSKILKNIFDERPESLKKSKNIFEENYKMASFWI